MKTRVGNVHISVRNRRERCSGGGMTCTEEEINDFCEELPRYKRPKKIIFEKVPRNPTGKIEKPVLRAKDCKGRLVESQITG